MNNEYVTFIKECIKNRKYLEFSYQDMSNCLIDVSAKDYENFEKGQYKMSKENLIRVARVLCIERPNTIDVSKYIDTNELDEDEVNDLGKVIFSIVGDENA